MNHHDIQFEIKSLGDSGTFSGMGSVYGNVDYGGDIVAPGAFTKSLQEFGSKQCMPAMLWQHRQGSPIGVYTKMVESDGGVYVEGMLAMKTQLGAEAFELMKMKAISGLSVGYITKDDAYDKKSGVRTIKEADLLEVSLVTFPMNDAARVSAVKNIESIRDLTSAESYLRDAGGLSRREAKAFISTLKTLNLRDADDDQSAELKAIANLLERRRVLMT